MTVAESLAELPALSVTVPLMTCPGVSWVTVVGALQLATPEVASEQTKVTVVSAVLHPLAFAVGDWTCVIVGAVLSTFTWAVLGVSTLPALSTLQNWMLWLPSVVTGTLVPVC